MEHKNSERISNFFFSRIILKLLIYTHLRKCVCYNLLRLKKIPCIHGHTGMGLGRLQPPPPPPPDDSNSHFRAKKERDIRARPLDFRASNGKNILARDFSPMVPMVLSPVRGTQQWGYIALPLDTILPLPVPADSNREPPSWESVGVSTEPPELLQL